MLFLKNYLSDFSESCQVLQELPVVMPNTDMFQIFEILLGYGPLVLDMALYLGTCIHHIHVIMFDLKMETNEKVRTSLMALLFIHPCKCINTSHSIRNISFLWKTSK